MVIPWSELVPYRKDGGSDDWTNLAVPANKLVKGSEGNTAYPDENLKTISICLEGNDAHLETNPIVLSNIYTYVEQDSS